MAFNPIFPTYAGLLPILKAAKGIAERDFVEALAWRCDLDGSTPGPDFARVQLAQMHSAEYPLLIITPSDSDPEPLGVGGVKQTHIMAAEITVEKSITVDDAIPAHNALIEELIRYADAVMMVWQSATADDWQLNFPGNSQGVVQVSCRNFIYGPILRSKEEGGSYARSVAFELQVKLLESEG